MLQDSFSEQPDLPTSRLCFILPVEQRIEYKLSLLCFKIISHQVPIYLSELLHLYTPSRQLRSSTDTRVQNTILPNKVLWSFSYQAPFIWNQLPVSVHHSTSVSSCKSSLKTFLFLKTFSSVSLPSLLWYATGVCVCVCACVHVLVCAFILYALNFDKYVFVKNV